MITELKFNPLTSNFDLIDVVPQLSSDPSSPNAEDCHVLKTTSGGGGGSAGQPIGLLLSLTQAGTGGTTSYQFSYRTKEGSFLRLTLS